MIRNPIGLITAVAWGVSIASPLRAAPTEFDFKDPKGVNTIAFTLDSLLEPIVGIASGVGGKVSFDPANPTATSGSISVETKNLQFANKGMQDSLRKADWLDVAKHPTVEFKLKKVTEAKSAGENVTEMTVVGDMTCHGVTKELTVPVKVTHLPGKLGDRTSKMTGDLLVLRSSFSIKRKDFGIKPEMSDKLVAEEIQVRVAIAGSNPKK